MCLVSVIYFESLFIYSFSYFQGESFCYLCFGLSSSHWFTPLFYVTYKLFFMFRTNRERLDVPLHHALLRDPLGAARAGLELGWVSVAGHRHHDGHVVGSGATLKLTPGLRRGGDRGQSSHVTWDLYNEFKSRRSSWLCKLRRVVLNTRVAVAASDRSVCRKY